MDFSFNRVTTVVLCAIASSKLWWCSGCIDFNTIVGIRNINTDFPPLHLWRPRSASATFFSRICQRYNVLPAAKTNDKCVKYLTSFCASSCLFSDLSAAAKFIYRHWNCLFYLQVFWGYCYPCVITCQNVPKRDQHYSVVSIVIHGTPFDGTSILHEEGFQVGQFLKAPEFRRQKDQDEPTSSLKILTRHLSQTKSFLNRA